MKRKNYSKLLFSLSCLLIIPSLINAGEITLAADLNTKSKGSEPSKFTEYNGKIYFSANDGIHGRELHIYDIETNSTSMIKDINPNGDSSPSHLTVYKNKLYFQAYTNQYGNELYAYDDNTKEVNLVEDLNTGDKSSYPSNLSVYGERLLFSATNQDNGTELFSYDGNSISIIEDLVSGTNSSSPNNLTTSKHENIKFVFTITETNGSSMLIALNEDYSINPTAIPLKYPFPSGDNLTSISNIINIDDSFFFIAKTNTSEKEIYKFQIGEGISKVNTGTNSINSFIAHDNKLYFSANSNQLGYELHIYDISTNTTTVIDFIEGSDSFYPNHLSIYEDKLFMVGQRADIGKELFVHELGTKNINLVKDIKIGEEGSNIQNVELINNYLYFSAEGSHGASELLHYNITSNEVKVAAIANKNTQGSFPRNLIAFNNKIYFSANIGDKFGNELYEYNPKTKKSRLVQDLNPGSNSSTPENFIVYNNKLYFQARTEETREEVYVYDPKTDKITLVVDTLPGEYNSGEPEYFTIYNGKLYFSAEGFNEKGEDIGQELFVYDGSTGETRLVKDILPGRYDSNPKYLTVYNGKLYFNAEGNNTNGTNVGKELFVYDDTSNEVNLVQDLIEGYSSGQPEYLTVLKGKLYFHARTNEYGDELFAYDDIDNKITLVKDIYTKDSGEGSDPSYLTVYNNKLYFRAKSDDKGQELHVHDPLTNTTKMLSDLYSEESFSSSDPRYLTVYNNKLYFKASSNDYKNALFSYDDENDQISLAENLQVGEEGINPEYLTVLDNKLFFKGYKEKTGKELYYFSSNDTPTIKTELNNITIKEDSEAKTYTIRIDDINNDNLTLSISSSDATIVAVNTNHTQTLTQGEWDDVDLNFTVKPILNASGTSNITLTVDDGDKSSTKTFDVTVRPENDAPTISSISNQIVYKDTPKIELTLKGVDVDVIILIIAMNNLIIAIS